MVFPIVGSCCKINFLNITIKHGNIGTESICAAAAVIMIAMIRPFDQERVVARIAKQHVIIAAACDRVIAITTTDYIGATIAHQIVIKF